MHTWVVLNSWLCITLTQIQTQMHKHTYSTNTPEEKLPDDRSGRRQWPPTHHTHADAHKKTFKYHIHWWIDTQTYTNTHTRVESYSGQYHTNTRTHSYANKHLSRSILKARDTKRTHTVAINTNTHTWVVLNSWLWEGLILILCIHSHKFITNTRTHVLFERTWGKSCGRPPPMTSNKHLTNIRDKT